MSCVTNISYLDNDLAIIQNEFEILHTNYPYIPSMDHFVIQHNIDEKIHVEQYRLSELHVTSKRGFRTELIKFCHIGEFLIFLRFILPMMYKENQINECESDE